jgi:hypothetical protein
MMVPAMQHEMGAGAPEDGSPCSDAPNDNAAAACFVKCCSAVAFLVDAQLLPTAQTIAADTAIAVLSPFAKPPDPPPPRM